jgi:hypothetical protein
MTDNDDLKELIIRLDTKVEMFTKEVDSLHTRVGMLERDRVDIARVVSRELFDSVTGAVSNDVNEIKEDTKSNRRLLIGTLTTGLASIVTAVVLAAFRIGG